MSDPNTFGKCGTCRHWTYRAGDERHEETLPGEHPHHRSLCDCAIDDDVWMGCDSCEDYHAREASDE